MKRSSGDWELAGAPQVQSIPHAEGSALTVGLRAWAQDGNLECSTGELLTLFWHCIQHTHLLGARLLSPKR